MNARRTPLIAASRFALLLAAVGCAVLVAAPGSARAARNPSTETKSLHEWTNFGSSVSGTTPSTSLAKSTVATPIFFPFKSGTVDLSALLRSGTTTGKLSISVFGYTAGAYTVSAVTESSSSTVVLGSLTVTSGSYPAWSGSNPILFDSVPVHSDVIIQPPLGLTSGSVVFGGTAAPFPDGFSPFDIATLSLTDSNGSLVSTATLSPPPDGFYSALSPLASGTAAPGATGYALIRANTPPVFLPLAGVESDARSAIWSGPTPITTPIIIDPLPPIFRSPKTGQIVIHAKGLPASTTLTYAADGTDLGTATTDASGNLTVFAAKGPHRKLPSTLDLFSVKTVTVHDASGTVLVSASF